MLKPYLQLPRAVHVLCVGTFINRAGTLLVPFLTLYLTKELGLSVTFATLAMGVFGLGSLVGGLLGGVLADLIGRRKVMLISLLGGALVVRGFSHLTVPWSILAAVGLFAVLADMYRPAAHAAIADLVEPTRRAHAFGLKYVAINLGFATGTAVGGLVATVWFTWLFWGDAATSAAYALIILFAIAETRPEDSPDESGGSDAAHASPESRGNVEPPSTDLSSALRCILRDHTFLVFCLASLCISLVYMQAMSSFPIYLDGLGFSSGDYGYLMAINGGMIVALQLPLTALFSRFNRATLIVVAPLISGVGFGLTGFAVTWLGFAMTVVVWTTGEMMAAPFMSAVVTDLAPTRYRARYLGVFSTCFSSGMMLGAPLGGLVLESLGGSYLWGGALGLAVFSGVLYLTIYPRMISGPSHEQVSG